VLGDAVAEADGLGDTDALGDGEGVDIGATIESWTELALEPQPQEATPDAMKRPVSNETATIRGCNIVNNTSLECATYDPVAWPVLRMMILSAWRAPMRSWS
jgi:hypothetical protein